MNATTRPLVPRWYTRSLTATARVGWVVVAVIVLNLFVFGLVPRYQQLSALSPVAVARLAQLGVTPSGYALLILGLEGLVVASFTLAAISLFWHRSNEPMVLLVALMLLLLGTMNGILVRSPWALATAHPFLESICLWLTGASYGLLVLFFLLFPTGRFAPPWTGWLTVPLLGLVATWTGVSRTDFLTGVWGPTLLLPVAIPLLGGLAGLQIYRYLRVSDEVQRQQTRWVVMGIAASVIGILEGNFYLQGAQSSPGSDALAQLFAYGISALALTILPLAFGVAITRHRLFEIDLYINRALVYGTLTACVVAGYALLVGLLSQLFQTGGNVLISLVATGVVAVLFQPLRERLQLGINRLMYGERDNPYAAIARLGRRLEGTLAPDAVLPAIVQTVREALKLPAVAIALDQGGEMVVVAQSGPATGEPVRLPLVYRQELVGELHLTPRAAGESFGHADRQLLDDLARQAGLAVHAARLTVALQHSRERLVVAREDERRRLRRDLHDGLGPTLGGLTLKLDVAVDLVEADPAAALALLRGLKAQTQTAIADIRRLAHGLRPPALDDLGLVGALQAETMQHEPGGLCVVVDAPPRLPPLPAAVEVAGYRIAHEALANVVRHAGAHSCKILLAPEDGALRIEVVDDGCGLPADRGRGIGLASMRERAEELGGSCLIESTRGCGTRVRAILPLSETGPEQTERWG